VGRLPMAAVVPIALAAGLFNPSVAGGWTAQLPGLVTEGELTRGSALDALTYSAASLAGPALAAVVAAGFGARAAVLTVTSVVSYAGIGMLLVCCPVLGAQRLGGPARGVLLISGIAVASLIANAILARRPGRGQPDVWVLASTLAIGVSMAAAAVAPGWLTLAAVSLTGAGEGPQLTALFAVRHRETPASMRGQVYTTAASLKIAGMAAGAALAGPLAGRSVTGCLLAAAGTELCAAAAYLLAGPGWLNRGRAPMTTPPGTACTGPAARTTARSEQGS